MSFLWDFKGTFSKHFDFNSFEVCFPQDDHIPCCFLYMFEANNVPLQYKLIEWQLDSFLEKSEKWKVKGQFKWGDGDRDKSVTLSSKDFYLPLVVKVILNSTGPLSNQLVVSHSTCPSWLTQQGTASS